MEETICRTSLVYYGLRNPETGEYLGVFQPPDEHCRSFKTGMGLNGCIRYKTVEEAQKLKQFYPQFSEIRKIKIVDIGEACE